ncbi:hypothetical protein CRUP_026702 [Coryphaenoides rupestris]|nr:hypothetical protein CRUP_026702 [Coryphaenoides rupestris]
MGRRRRPDTRGGRNTVTPDRVSQHTETAPEAPFSACRAICTGSDSTKVFYEDPRYILFIHMVINDAIQLTVTILLFVLSYVYYQINVSFCCVCILLAVFTTRNTPVNLASMAIERYIAICQPLRHAQVCTVRRTYALIGLIWFLSVTPDVADLFATLATEPPSFFHSSVFCLRQNVFKDPVLAYKRQVFDALYFSAVFLVLVYTYLRILFTARRAHATESKASARRARNTVLLHGAQLAMCMLSYISPGVEAALHLGFPGNILEIRFANYLVVYILPRFLSPVVYGVRDRKFRQYLRKYFVGTCGAKAHKSRWLFRYSSTEATSTATATTPAASPEYSATSAERRNVGPRGDVWKAGSCPAARPRGVIFVATWEATNKHVRPPPPPPLISDTFLTV